MAPEELNDILLYAVPNVWAKHAYLQSCGFEGRNYKDSYEMFEHIEIVEHHIVITLLQLISPVLDKLNIFGRNGNHSAVFKAL